MSIEYKNELAIVASQNRSYYQNFLYRRFSLNYFLNESIIVVLIIGIVVIINVVLALNYPNLVLIGGSSIFVIDTPLFLKASESSLRKSKIDWYSWSIFMFFLLLTVYIISVDLGRLQ